MNKNGYIIRLEENKDHRQVENLVRESFWNVYRPGCDEHYLLHVLRTHPDFIPELNFVMEKDGDIIGQVVFVKATIITDDDKPIPVLTLGPICIANEYKRQGYGKLLLDFSLEKATLYGAGAVCLEGNMDFYGKSGFVKASTFGIRHYGIPADEDPDFFLCKVLRDDYLDGVRGEYHTSDAYNIAEEDTETFDQTFPPKVKLKLPGQLF